MVIYYFKAYLDIINIIIKLVVNKLMVIINMALAINNILFMVITVQLVIKKQQ